MYLPLFLSPILHISITSTSSLSPFFPNSLPSFVFCSFSYPYDLSIGLFGIFEHRWYYQYFSLRRGLLGLA